MNMLINFNGIPVEKKAIVLDFFHDNGWSCNGFGNANNAYDVYVAERNIDMFNLMIEKGLFNEGGA